MATPRCYPRVAFVANGKTVFGGASTGLSVGQKRVFVGAGPSVSRLPRVKNAAAA